MCDSRSVFKSVRLGLVALFSLAILFSAERGKVQIYWTDRGINNFVSGWSTGAVVPDIPESGLIKIPMPPDAWIAKGPNQWQSFSDSVYGILKARIPAALDHGSGRFEILTLQDIKTGGYLSDTQRQHNVDDFTRAVASALQRVKSELQRTADVNVIGIAGSNGGRSFSETIPGLAKDKKNPLDSVVFVDSRGMINKTQDACLALAAGCTIIHDKGDIPGMNIVAANLAAAKRIQGAKIRVIEAALEGPDPVGTRHIAVMSGNTPLTYREWIDGHYTEEKTATRGELLQAASAPPAVSSQQSGITGNGLQRLPSAETPTASASKPNQLSSIPSSTTPPRDSTTKGPDLPTAKNSTPVTQATKTASAPLPQLPPISGQVPGAAGTSSVAEKGDPFVNAVNINTTKEYGADNPYLGSNLLPDPSGSRPSGTQKGSVPNPTLDTSLKILTLSDPNKPTKILIVNGPTSPEVGLQNPLSEPSQIPLKGAAAGPTDAVGGSRQTGNTGTLSTGTLKKTASGDLAYTPNALDAAGKAGRDANQDSVGIETISGGTLKKTASGDLAYNPNALDAAGRAGRNTNQDSVGIETISGGTLKKTASGDLTYNPNALDAAGKAGRNTNQDSVGIETISGGTLKKTASGDLAYNPNALDAAGRLVAMRIRIA